MNLKSLLFYIAISSCLFAAAQNPTEKSWWNNFNDPTLDSLIFLGQNNNLDLAQALKRIEISRQAVKEAKSSYYPQLNLNLGWSRNRTSAFVSDKASGSITSSYFQLGVDMSWEIDLFGKITASVKEQKEAYKSTREDYDWMCVTVAAEIATAYMNLRTLQQELVVTQQHIEQEEKVLKITEARHEAGLASMLDVAQAKTVYYSTKASIITLQTQIYTTINSIAVLIGAYPEEVQKWLSPVEKQPTVQWTMDVEISPELLRNRPDVKEAEYLVEEYAAALGVEKKQWLPSFSISAGAGTESWHIRDLFKGNSYYYSVAPQLSWTIFDGLARDAQIASAREQLMESVDSYNLTLLNAVQEVDNALMSYAQAVEYEKEISVVLENAQLAYTLAIDRYRQGLDAFINVSDALITVLQYANELVVARGNVLTSFVTLQKSLVL